MDQKQRCLSRPRNHNSAMGTAKQRDLTDLTLLLYVHDRCDLRIPGVNTKWAFFFTLPLGGSRGTSGEGRSTNIAVPRHEAIGAIQTCNGNDSFRSKFPTFFSRLIELPLAVERDSPWRTISQKSTLALSRFGFVWDSKDPKHGCFTASVRHPNGT